jgi:hypothetical protein
MKGAAFFLLLGVALAPAMPSFAQAPEAVSSTSEEPGSVLVFPKFSKGTVAVDGVIRPQTEIEVGVRCPSGATCTEDEPVKIRFHWVCPGSPDQASNYVCKEADFDVELSVNGKASLKPENPNPNPLENNAGLAAPCPSGYLIGWVISPVTDRPIKYDGLTGSAILRDGQGVIQSYEAFAIQADRNLANRAEITTDIDPRTGISALVFDGGAGHYEAVAGGVPTNLEYHKLTGPLASGKASLILLTLDVRLNRPNYATFVDVDFITDQGDRASTSWNFRCWTEIQHPAIDAHFTLAGARNGNAVILAGRAEKVPFSAVSDIPGPVTLLGLVPADEGRGRRTMDPAYIVQKSDSSKPTTVFVPFKATEHPAQ